ncbi:hypothetical protein B9X73_03970 [Acinetobacter baumannii]|uniref:hypothetical protein n=1 Tax=Acinetobacter baumannii TaxID=470 RepID=UPI0004454CB3|nr:hypothetical protein [Acinetobacter baumannii]EXE02546.1 hypothetical protein J556_3545 [Acinetobacter baumannii 1096934]EXF19131.1 hypothetical protein J601_2685 [Acinetobacter baumannii 831240]KRI88265.1 hypothetical protein APC70_19230 [Acinetobacter baumannii]MCA4275582.1 hypothetical protein [Acinetobacter baumannii]MCT9450904.1 hypothetical protein [Acinetobacter baumannii]
MSNEYPKMLYKGDLVNFEYTTANSEEHQEELKADGWVEHRDLKAAKPEVEVIAQASGSSGELAEAKKKIIELEEQLATAKGEYISQINALKKENDTYKYSAMDAGELKAILDEKGVKYGSRDGKDVLVKLVLDSEYNTQDEE